MFGSTRELNGKKKKIQNRPELKMMIDDQIK